MNQSELFNEAPPATSHVNPLAAALVTTCRKCGGAEYVDHRLEHAPHNGTSVRRDCARCGWTMGFPTWHGEQVEVSG